ncbi:hypothetical protein EXW96_22780 [Paenibacillus sp. JMULE4]|uniref:hypothetical protein n=1 Tax=Paenibacillus sp. JMULE4 TaxID=2518342 RepID=UPI00157612CC|nr:hypothetical protein [Paenibacillus sp. JMULE4]NTZ20266.1 hypothetical protein [Paenibacillus sp. JMULE4]
MAVKQNLDETLVDYQKFESRNFRITPKIALVLGQIYYIEGDYDKASQAIYTALSNDFNVEFNRIMARWYLASLLKQNKQDEN